MCHQSFTFPVNCKVDDWSAWSECSLACGGGTKTKTREVIQQPNHVGETCPALEEKIICNTEECPGSLLVFSFLIMIITSLLNVDLQLTAKLTIGLHGAIAVLLAAGEPRPKLERSFSNRSMGERRVRLWRRKWSAILTNAQVLFSTCFLIFIITSLLIVDLQLTAKLAIGLHGAIAL